MIRNVFKVLFLVFCVLGISVATEAEMPAEQPIQELPEYIYLKDESTKTCTLTKIISTTGVESITVPVEYDGCKVTKITADTFTDIQGIKEVILLGDPEFLKEEGVELFINPTEITFYYYTGSKVEKTLHDIGGSLVSMSEVKALKVSKRSDLQSADMTWAAYPGASGYSVMIKLAKGYKMLATVKDTSFTAKKLKAGAKYEFKVCALIPTITGNALQTLYSKPANVTLKPKKVKKISATALRSKIKLSWSKVKDISGYQIQRMVHIKLKGFKPKFSHVKTIKGRKKTKLTNVMLVPGMKYSYRIRTYKTVAKKKIYSNWLTIKKKRCR